MKKFLLLAALLLVAVTSAYARFTFKSIDFPGAVATRALGINDKGWVVGSYTDSSGNRHGFLLKDRVFASIDAPGATYTSPRGVNNSGDIVGSYSDSSGAFYGFLLSKGKFTTLSFPGSVATYAFGLNNTGQIVGFYSNDGVFFEGYLYQKGTYSTFTPLAGTLNQDALAIGINDAGTIVGAIDDNGPAMGFSQTSDQYFTFAFQGAYTTAKGINRDGDIVGGYAYVAGQGHGALLSHGISVTLDFPGAVSTSLNAIDSLGDLVGLYDLSDGTEHGMLIQPRTQNSQN